MKLVFACALAAAACGGDQGPPTFMSPAVTIVPSAGLPSAIADQTSNNNLDVVKHTDGRFYLAFRTAPNHFASTSTVLYVVSSSDEQSWQLETQIAMDTDLREPRLL